MKIWNYILLTMTLFLFSGCGASVNYLTQQKKLKPISTKNYEKDTTKEAYVGQTMIREKNYYIYRYSSKSMTTQSDFRITNDMHIDLSVNSGQEFEKMGTTTIDNKLYTVLLYANHHRKYEGYKLLIDNNNKLFNKILNGTNNIKMIYTFDIYPSEVYFEDSRNGIIKSSDILKDKPYINYEIVFSGITKDTIRLLYREYSPDDLARNAFFQELTYPINTKLIRFKDLKIKVEKLDGEKIKFKVL